MSPLRGDKSDDRGLPATLPLGDPRSSRRSPEKAHRGDSTETFKAECLARWRERAPKRRKFAIQVLNGRRSIPDEWPQWQKFEVQAEVNLLRKQREKGR